jgi:dipeptidase E
MRLLLLSNSTMKGTPYLEWPQSYLQTFLKDVDELLFIPYAGVTMSYDDYTNSVAMALEPTGTKVLGIHSVDDKQSAIENAQCIAVGGGNTFHLLATMQSENIIAPINRAVVNGASFIGWSAGSNVACPTIMTTNDMPIIEPQSFAALNLIDFQINAHYTVRTIEGHGGESRDLRLKELLVINKEMKVVGLPEGKLLELNDDKWYLRGIEGEQTLLFRAEHEPVPLNDGEVTI